MLLLLASSRAPPHLPHTVTYMLAILTQDREKEIKKMRGEVPIFSKQVCLAWRAAYTGTLAPSDESEAESNGSSQDDE